MDTFEAINTRRSVRQFTDQSVDEETIQKILNAAMNAPSAGNQQLWHFIVVNQREILNKIAESHPYAKMCQQAPLAILCCADTSLEKHKDFWVQDLAAATQNILLAVRALGLGAVWCGIHPRKEREEPFKNLLNIPQKIQLFNIIAIGHTDIEQKAVNRYKKERVHKNKW